MKTLILNADSRPLSIVSDRRAVVLDLNNSNVTALSYYDQFISTTNGSIPIPAVMIYSKYILIDRKAIPTKKSIKLRDNNKCGYCGIYLSSETFTIDHIIPISKFSNKMEANTWENLVSCCRKCNSLKGDKTLAEARMTLLIKPKPFNQMLPCESIPEEWTKYIQ